MKWYEYKTEVDDLHASDDLKARLLAMQPAQAPAPRKKAVRFPTRRVLNLAAGFAVGVVCVGVVGSQVFSGLPLGGAGYSASSSAAMAAGAAPKMASYQLEAENAMLDTASAQARDGGQAAQGRQSTQEAKIIYTARLTIESKDYDTTRAALDDALDAAGGYMESVDEYAGTGPEDQRSLSLTLRVPQDSYASFLDEAAKAGNLVSKSQQAEDVTAQYVDLAARIENLEAQRTRLLALQAEAETLADLLEIESSLSDVQYQLESWQSQMDWYDDQIQCCTVYISLNEVQVYSPTAESFAQRLAGAFAEGWQSFVAGSQQLAVWLVTAWPLVVLAAAAAAAVVLVRRARRR